MIEKNKILILLVASCFLLTCENRPKEILPENKMEAVMYDLFLFEGAAQIKNILPSDSIKNQYYNQILKKNGITLAQYDSSLAWYIKDPERYTAMQESVLKRIQKLQKEIKAGKYVRPIAPNDSLDSAQIRIERRDIFIAHDGSNNQTKYALNSICKYSGELLKASYVVNFEGNPSKVIAASKIEVFYDDNTKDEKNMELKLEDRMHHFEIAIQTNPQKKVKRVLIDLFTLKNGLEPTQRIYINNITMWRVFNPFRNVK